VKVLQTVDVGAASNSTRNAYFAPPLEGPSYRHLPCTHRGLRLLFHPAIVPIDRDKLNHRSVVVALAKPVAHIGKMEAPLPRPTAFPLLQIILIILLRRFTPVYPHHKWFQARSLLASATWPALSQTSRHNRDGIQTKAEVFTREYARVQRQARALRHHARATYLLEVEKGGNLPLEPH